MKKTAFQRGARLRFRRFAHKRWAVFNSLHREVTIGRLSAKVADCSLAKAAVMAALLLVLQGNAQAQSDREGGTKALPEVEITAGAQQAPSDVAQPAAVLTAEDLKDKPIHSLADLMALLPGVDMRVRGVGDAQGDLSMRGGTFDQMVLLLNGINLTDAQTGHHTMDISIDIAMVKRVELLTPAQCMARGVVAFCGAVNLVVDDDYRDRLVADMGLGSYGTADASLLGTKTAGAWALTAAAAYHRSDGYRRNTDYRHGSLLLQAMRHGTRSDWHLQLGGQLKGFGSEAFYSTAYPDQYEATRTLCFSATNRFRWSRFDVSLSAYGRLHRDRFELFRDGAVPSIPAWYGGHNHHLSSLGGLAGRAARPLGHGELLLGADLRREGIWSNVLGEPDSTLRFPYTHSARRLSASLYGGYGFSRGRFGAEATLLGNCNTAFGPNYGFAASVRFADARLQLSRTYRLPTFTDLYYQSATQVANPRLAAEHSTCVELGVRKAFPMGGAALSAYYRDGRDIIGWVRPTADDLWYSMNHLKVQALGVDAEADLRLSLFSLRLAYSFCHIVQDEDGMIASSALDHLRHKLSACLTVRLSDFRLLFTADYRYREGQYVADDGSLCPYGGALLLGARAEYEVNRVTIYVEGRNLADVEYLDFGGIPQPGITARVGVRLSL